MQRLDRVGYGANFNDIFLSDTKKDIIKQSKNKYGDEKITREIIFYKFLEKVQHNFPVPVINQYVENGYTMHYYCDYVPLYLHFPKCCDAEKTRLLGKVYKHLNSLHSIMHIPVSFDTYFSALMVECRDKLRERHSEVASLLSGYDYIRRVNGVALLDFETILDKIHDRLLHHVGSLRSYEFVLIHGDCQFNNILYNAAEDKMIFIDPRGYFGTQALFGVAAYDFAKVKFALSGYDIFDNMASFDNKVDGDNLVLPDLFQISEPLGADYESVLAIAIWMGNAHMFKENLTKMVFSYFYARYLASVYL